MCQENYNTNKRKFKQLTYKERIKIETLYNELHLSYTEIGKIVGKHRTTISREIKQGLMELETSYLAVWKYCAEVGQRKNEENETAKGANLKIGNDMKLASFIEKEIKEGKSSPEVIEYKIKQRKFLTTLCFKTIYNYIEKSYTGSKKARSRKYYADSYSSWQRGTNENINKMIRRFLPKGRSFKDLTKEEVKRIEKWINNYPRKILKFKTSEEYYEEEMKVV